MSHFLSRLVQRTRGEVATVRPTRHAVTAPDPTAAAWDEQVTVREAAPLASTAQAAYTAPWAPSPGMAPLGDPSDERVPIGDAAPASWTAAVEPSMRLASARRSAEATDDQVAMREISSSAVGARMVGPTLASAAPRAGTQISTQIGAQIDAQIGSQIEAQVDREAVPAEAGQAGPFARSATAEAPLRSTAAALVAPAERAPEIRLRRVVALTPASDPRIAPRDPVGSAVTSGRIVATSLAAGDAPVTGPLAAAPPGAGFATALVGTRIHERSGDGAQSPGEQSTVIARPMLDQPVRRTGQLTAPLALARADGPAPDPAGRGGAARRASESPDSSLHEAATTVEVSIGRIEVRLPPRPRGSGRDPVSPKRPPVVGLAEYLRARDSGKPS